MLNQKKRRSQAQVSKEYTGGLVNYYLVQVTDPQRPEQPPYQAECEDIISALGLDFDEGNIFKGIWRKANARKGLEKKGHSEKYDDDKIFHYASRLKRRHKE